MERSQLCGIFVGLGAAVVKEERVVTVTAGLAQTLRQFLLKRIDHAVGVKSYLIQLVLERGHIVRVRMPHRNNGVAAVEVEILLSIAVPDLASQGLDRSDIK